MSELVFSIATVLVMIPCAASGYSYGQWMRTVRGTPRSFVMKSLGKASSAVAVLSSLLWLANLPADMEDILKILLFVGFLPGTAFHVWIFCLLVKDDEDDWFSSKWKKLKLWLKKAGTFRHVKPAVAS